MISKIFLTRSSIKTIMAVSCLLLLTSCARQIHITHNSFANTRSIPQGFPMQTSFTVEPISNKDPMLCSEIAHKIEHILQNKGYCIEDELDTRYYVLFDYQMERSKKTVNVEKYIPGETITSYGSVFDRKGAKVYQEETLTAGKFVTVPEVRTFFTKSILIQVYDARSYREHTKSTPLWQGSAACCDENDDLRDALDYLLVISLKYFGKNTQKTIETTVSSDDENVTRLRTEIFRP